MARLISFALLCLALVVSACGGSGGSGGNEFPETPNDALFAACEELNGITKVINGERCNLDDSSVVRLDIFSLAQGVSLCSGVVVTPTKILTAAHCFPPSGATVFGIDVVSPGVATTAINFSIHPNFTLNNIVNAAFDDVAIVEVGAPLSANPVSLLTSRSPGVGEAGLIAGFGQDENGGAEVLEAGTSFVSDVTPNHIFSAFDGQAGSNPCFGDSGGPIMFADAAGEFAVSGVVSTGRADVDNCGAGDVTLYIRLSDASVLDFILAAAPEVQLR